MATSAPPIPRVELAYAPTPLLKLDRIVYAIDGRPIEWRVASCHLRDMHYMTEVH